MVGFVIISLPPGQGPGVKKSPSAGYHPAVVCCDGLKIGPDFLNAQIWYKPTISLPLHGMSRCCGTVKFRRRFFVNQGVKKLTFFSFQGLFQKVKFNEI